MEQLLAFGTQSFRINDIVLLAWCAAKTCVDSSSISSSTRSTGIALGAQQWLGTVQAVLCALGTVTALVAVAA